MVNEAKGFKMGSELTLDWRIILVVVPTCTNFAPTRFVSSIVTRGDGGIVEFSEADLLVVPLVTDV